MVFKENEQLLYFNFKLSLYNTLYLKCVFVAKKISNKLLFFFCLKNKYEFT